MTCLLAMFSFLFFSCEGPAGPAGDVGPQGLDGPQGQQGEQGDEGNANVKISIFTVYDWEWNQSSSSLWYYEKSLSIITTEIVNNGIVVVFLKSTNSDHWQALPYTWPGTYEKITRFWYSTNFLELDIYSESSSYVPASNYRFKVAAIDGTIVENAKNHDIDLNDYYQFKDYFNLE